MKVVNKREESHRLRVQADAISATLPSILVAAKRIAASVTMGSHGRRRAGVGDSFWQFRPYNKDDSPQSIDWRQSAKVDMVFVREREWVVAQTAALWCDTSPSMRYRSSPKLPTKAERAAVMMLTTAELLTDAGERILRISGDGRPVRAAAHGRLAVAQMADALAVELIAEPKTDAPEMPAFSNALPKHSTVVLLSDFLAPLEEVASAVRGLSRLGVSGHMLQILDPAEETLPFSGRVRFVGMEKEGATVIDRAEEARAGYVRKLNSHRDGLRALATSVGWSFGLHHTDNSPQPALAALHNAITGHRR
jgi:uncharacterized protein (DUF58 family)